MAHKYSNFASPYATLAGRFSGIKSDLGFAATHAGLARDSTSNPVSRSDFIWLINAVDFLIELIESLGDFGEASYDQSHLFESIYWAYADVPNGEPYVLTWKKICEAWAVNDFEGRAVTIAFIDRMRELIWDEPFSAQWAAKPEEEF
ncbi:hypothetical protein ES703_104086 [subsurface metagenome]